MSRSWSQIFFGLTSRYFPGKLPGEVSGPGEHHEEDGGVVMDEHLPEVLPLHVEELTEGERPVESHLYHVVEPDVSGHFVVRIVYKAVVDVPEPVLGPQYYQPV